ncbi:XrtA/PEP-CTERM system histidine kinase PrsK [Alteromonas sp. ASW11-130]|uniref:XrtA/PEP-CTERM system histidine kinase PrsK n=1 Tax=Alteromonas sp. ASW11-130 TaxID=3015775 RepID=UPI0022420C5E|nr:XrtA/PEP-CTERM system histidine kinase PrsK [Alteromonas sp. ASW11-130]MCW8091644.1 PEP-CTERM system histidine kinase PrsK [Alteromonas sp. ASW11-130]
MIADIGYGLSFLAYMVLLLLLLTVRKSGLAKHLLVLGTMVTMVWSLGFVSIIAGPVNINYLFTADILKQLVWLLFIASCLRNDFENIWQVLARPATFFILLPPVLTLLIPTLIPVTQSWYYFMLTVMSLEILILLEVMYRQAGSNQWTYKPLVLYLGTAHLFEFVMYTNATMVNQVEIGYIAARGYIYLLLTPLLVIAMRRIKHWGIDIFISRDVVLHSSLLLVAGIYLFCMALIGYAINYFGGSWGATVQLVLIVMSLVLLATLILSNSFRTKIKVFITKHFFANQFDYRIEWVKLTQALSTETENLPQVYCNALKGFLGAINYDQGMLVKVSTMDVEEVGHRNIDNLNSAEAKLVRQLTHYCNKTAWLIDFDEFQIKPFNYSDLQLDREALKACRFQLALPIFKADKVWGFALLAQSEGELVSLNWEVRDYLTAVTDQVATYILHNEAAMTVAENAQFAAFNRMSAFVLHDLKNVSAQIDLILCNAEQHKSNPEFIEDTFETLHYTKARMDKMLRQLTDKKIDKVGLDSAEKLSSIISTVIDSKCQQLLPLPTMKKIEEAAVVVDPEKFANVVYHLISNAQQATPDDGAVTVQLELDHESNRQLVRIEDTGCGMDQTFIKQRLFKPFDTTKGNAGMGIGAFDARNYMESIGGKLFVTSVVGEGTCFTLAFPLD